MTPNKTSAHQTTNPLVDSPGRPQCLRIALAYTDSTRSCKTRKIMANAFDHNKGRKFMILPTTLTAAGIAALINLWLAVRCGQVRTSEKVSIGDGGNDALIRRMRAHSNFAEFTPIVLILIGAIEFSVGTTMWLWAVMGVFMLGRVAHGLGMDGKGFTAGGRSAGILITFLITLGLGIYALAIPHLSFNEVTDVPVEAAMAR